MITSLVLLAVAVLCIAGGVFILFGLGWSLVALGVLLVGYEVLLPSDGKRNGRA